MSTAALSYRGLHLPCALTLDVPPGHVVTIVEVADDGRPVGAPPVVLVSPSAGEFDLYLWKEDFETNDIDLHVVPAAIQRDRVPPPTHGAA